MGDVAMLPHALRALISAYPDLRVTVATRPMFKPFFEGLGVDFLDVDLKGVHHSLRQFNLRLAGSAVAGSPAGRLNHGAGHVGAGMPEQHGSP